MIKKRWLPMTLVFLMITVLLCSYRIVPVNASTPGAYDTGIYRNLFKELGKTDAEIQAKVDNAFNKLFYGSNNTERVYYPVGTDMAYIRDVANNDVRSEGQSYGMMIAVQLDKKQEFDRLWKWAKTYMQNKAGHPQEGFFAWQVRTDGTVIDANPAPDGEEYFITALFFAAHRWGNGTGIFNYEAEAQTLLDRVLTVNGYNTYMFNPIEKQVVFTPIGTAADFTDPSYHLPSFYELWALWDNNNNQFWRDVAATSREYFKAATHPTTGLGPDYANFDGTPTDPWNGGHADFRFDAWRIAHNIAMDYAWWQKDSWQRQHADRIQAFFRSEGITSYVNQYTLDGVRLSRNRSTGLIAMNAVTALASSGSGLDFVQELWNASVPAGTYRYYDGMLYMLGLLHCSGNYKIYKPSGSGTSDTTAPTAPKNLRATTITDLTVTLAWDPSTDNVGVVGYTIYRDGVQIDTTNQLSYKDENVSPSTTYTYTVKAFDAAGNLSNESNVLTITTNQAYSDTTPPTAPTNLTFTAKTATTVSLQWNPSTDNVGVAGYEVYRDGVMIAKTPETRYIDSGLQKLTAYTYTVRAYDASGNISAPSNSISVKTAAK
jgi:endo-1,4-beta-D-glucanase Y/chitodextrinase